MCVPCLTDVPFRLTTAGIVVVVLVGAAALVVLFYLVVIKKCAICKSVVKGEDVKSTLTSSLKDAATGTLHTVSSTIHHTEHSVKRRCCHCCRRSPRHHVGTSWTSRWRWSRCCFLRVAAVGTVVRANVLVPVVVTL